MVKGIFLKKKKGLKMIKSMKNFILILAVAFIWESFSNDLEDTTPSKTSQINENHGEIDRISKAQIVREASSVISGALLVGIGAGIGIGAGEVSEPVVMSIGMGSLVLGMAAGVPGAYHCYRIIRKLSKANPGFIK